MAAIREWRQDFQTVGRAVRLEDLVLLGDCYYLPHEQGPGAEAFFSLARAVLGRRPTE